MARAQSQQENQGPSPSTLWNLLQEYSDGVLAENAQRRLVLVNQRFCDIFGIDAPPVALRGMDCAFAAEQSKALFVDEQGFLDRIEAILIDRTTVKGELLQLKDGRILERDFIPMVDRQRPAGHVWVYRDATEKVQRDEDLRKEHLLRGAVLSSALDAVIVIDAKGAIVEFNPAAELMFGYSRADVVHRPMHDMIMPPQYRNAHMAGMQHYLTTGEGPVLGKRIEIEAMRASGEIFPIELAITPITTKEGQLFTAYIRDITIARKNQALLEDHRAAALAVSQASTWLLEHTDVARVISRTVKHVASALHAERAHVFEHIDGGGVFAGVRPYCLWSREMDETDPAEKGIELRTWDPVFSRWRSEFELNRPIYGHVNDLPESEAAPLKQQGIVSMAIVPIFVDGVLWGTVGFDHITRDVDWSETEISILIALAASIGSALKRERLTYALLRSEESLRSNLRQLQEKSGELEQATAMLINQERMATLGMITSSVAHEINSPLGAILNSAERALSEGAVSATQQKNLELIVRAALRSKDVIERLLATSRNSSEEGGTCDVVHAITDCRELYGRQLELLGITLVTDQTPLPPAQIGHSELLQIITNLLTNARDAVLSSGADTSPTIDVQASTRGNMIDVVVLDSGPGIPDAVLQHAFEPFYTTKERGKGTGLGLWISRRIARDAGGDLVLENTDRGARATISIPVAAQPEVHHEEHI